MIYFVYFRSVFFALVKTGTGADCRNAEIPGTMDTGRYTKANYYETFLLSVAGRRLSFRLLQRFHRRAGPVARNGSGQTGGTFRSAGRGRIREIERIGRQLGLRAAAGR